MLNYLWPIIIILSFFYSVFSGNMEALNEWITSSLDSVVKLSITLASNMCLWCRNGNGQKNIINKKVKKDKYLKPVLFWLMPDVKKNDKALENVSINIISNILGLGNGRTPAGISAMSELEK